MSNSDFMKGSKGGSYKCDSQLTTNLNSGINFKTTNLQYSAFNSGNATTFNDSKLLNSLFISLKMQGEFPALNWRIIFSLSLSVPL